MLRSPYNLSITIFMGRIDNGYKTNDLKKKENNPY